MAVPTPSKSFIDEIKDNLECPICADQFKNPKILPCFHTFCENCIEQYVKTTGNPFPCPVCRVPVHVPSEGVGGLKNNCLVNNLLDTVVIHDTVNHICTICEEAAPADFMCESDVYICGNCKLLNEQLTYINREESEWEEDFSYDEDVISPATTPSVDYFDDEENERKHFVLPGNIQSQDYAASVTSPPRLTPEMLKAIVLQPFTQQPAPKLPTISSIRPRQTPVMSAHALRSPVVRNRNQPPDGDELFSELKQRLNRRQRFTAVDSDVYVDSSQANQSHETNATAVHQVDFRSILKRSVEIKPENRTDSLGMVHSFSASEVSSVHQQSPKSAQKSEPNPTQGDEALIGRYRSLPAPIVSLRDAMKNINIKQFF